MVDGGVIIAFRVAVLRSVEHIAATFLSVSKQIAEIIIATLSSNGCAFFAPRAILGIYRRALPLFRRLGDNINHTGYSAFTVQRRGRTAYHFDTGNVSHRNLVNIYGVIVAGHYQFIPVDLATIHHDEDARVAI